MNHPTDRIKSNHCASRFRAVAILAGCTAAALVFAGCGSSSDEAEAPYTVPAPAHTDKMPQPEKSVGTIKVASLPIPHNVQFMELNRFAKAYGLDVEWISFQRYSDTQLAVSRGDVDFAAAGYHTIALDTAPKNVQMVAGGNSGAQALVLRDDIEVKDWSDLKGLKIGVAPNSGPDVQFRLAAEEHGFDESSIKRVNFTTIGPPTLVALKKQEIDGMLCWEVVCAQAVSDGVGQYSSLDIGDNPTQNANTVVLANSAFTAKNPKATELLIRAYVDAVEHFSNNPADWQKAMTAATGSKPEVLQEAFGAMHLEWKLYRDRALATAKAYADFGISSKDMSKSVDSYLNYQFLEAATQRSESEVGG